MRSAAEPQKAAMAQEQRVFGTPLDQATTEFAKRNPLLVCTSFTGRRAARCSVHPAPAAAAPAFRAAPAASGSALLSALCQAAFVPDRWENAVDKLLPDSFEARMESKAQAAARESLRLAPPPICPVLRSAVCPPQQCTALPAAAAAAGCCSSADLGCSTRLYAPCPLAVAPAHAPQPLCRPPHCSALLPCCPAAALQAATPK